MPTTSRADVDSAIRCLEDGRYREALRLVQRALDVAPDDPDLLFARARALYAWGRNREALQSYRRAEFLGSADPELHLQLGWCCALLDRQDEAETWMRKAVAGGVGQSAAHYGLAVVLVRQRKLDEAAAEFGHAVAMRPDDLLCRIALGNCVLEQGNARDAEAHFRFVIARDGGSSLAWRHLGLALSRQQRVEESVIAYETATRLEERADRNSDTFIELAVSLRDAGRVHDSIAVLEASLAERPSVQGFIIYGMMLLAAGRLRDAWQYYDFRWLNEPQLSLRPKFPIPLWNGQDLQNRSILLHVEQGLGDVIQFVRYARHLKALGATVSLVTSRVLLNLAGTIPGVDRVLGPGEVAQIFDYYVPLLGLPRRFGTDDASIPAEIPYLFADPARVQDARAQVLRAAGAALKVGLVWSGAAGNDYNKRRAVPLSMLAPLLDIPDVCWFSLQKGGEGVTAEEHVSAARLVSLEIRNDFDGTAALVDALDLVVSVDTSLAHLAGALGKPVWLMLPNSPHWVWQEGREDSPWYPTMRLFRQTRPGQWDDVVERVKAAIAGYPRGGTGSASPETNPAARSRALSPICLPPRRMPDHRPGFAAVAETRHAILAYLPDAPGAGDAIGWYGEWQEAQLRLFIDLLRPGSTVVIVEAGAGAHAVPIGAALGAEGHLILYESRPPLRRILHTNLVANRARNATLMNGMLAGSAANGETIDELLLDRLDWIKTDEARATPVVLAGVDETMWRLRPKLFLAIADDAAFAATADAVRAFGYRCWRHEVPLFNPANFNRRDDDISGGRRSISLLAIPEEIDVNVTLTDCVEYG